MKSSVTRKFYCLIIYVYVKELIMNLRFRDPSTSALHLKAAISSLPALTEKKRTIDMHMNIATALLKEIKERSLDAFIVTEESINKQTKSSMLETITNKTKGSPEDKLRCFILFYLNSDSEISKADMNEYEMALTNSGCDLASLRYLKQIKSIIQMTNTSQLLPSSANKGVLGRFSSTLADNLNATGFGGALDTLISGVKNILPTRQNLPILRIVNSLCETGGGLSANLTQIGGGGGSNPDEEYLYLDPMMPQAKKPPRGAAKAVFQDIFVFVVGGGNYVEYQNLQEYSKVQLSGKRIIYGSTEICNAASFLSQLGTLGGSGTKA